MKFSTRIQRSMTSFVYGLAFIGALFTAPVQAETYFFHNDHLGTPQSVSDTDQEIAWEVNQQPFGEGVITTNTVEQNIRFPGQYADVETGLSYNYFRTYDSSVGRYSQSDPIGLQGGLNTYSYVSNRPVTYVDPLGLFDWPRWPQSIYNQASSDAQQSGLPGPHNGPQDAFRHCLASCESSRVNGEAATQCIAWANEKKGDWQRGQEEGERAMDDHNNAVGINFGNSAKNYQQCHTMCMGAVNSNKTINQYTPGSTLNYSPLPDVVRPYF